MPPWSGSRGRNGARSRRPGRLLELGWAFAEFGRNGARSRGQGRQRYDLFQGLGDHYGQAATWDSLGYAHHHLGQHTQAIACYQHALHLYRDIRDHYEEAVTLTRLGDTHHTASDPDAARTAWQQALTILDQLDHPDADAIRTKLVALDTPTHIDQPLGE